MMQIDGGFECLSEALIFAANRQVSVMRSKVDQTEVANLERLLRSGKRRWLA